MCCMVLLDKEGLFFPFHRCVVVLYNARKNKQSHIVSTSRFVIEIKFPSPSLLYFVSLSLSSFTVIECSFGSHSLVRWSCLDLSSGIWRLFSPCQTLNWRWDLLHSCACSSFFCLLLLFVKCCYCSHKCCVFYWSDWFVCMCLLFKRKACLRQLSKVSCSAPKILFFSSFLFVHASQQANILFGILPWWKPSCHWRGKFLAAVRSGQWD